MVVLATASYAQYGSLRDTGPGAGLSNTGRTMVWTGLGMAVSGAAFLGFSEMDYRLRYADRQDGMNTMNMAPVFALGGALIGGGMAVAGSLLMLAGNSKYDRAGQGEPISGGSLVGLSPEGARGAGLMLEFGGGIPPFVEGRFIGGYHFNQNIFLGGGLGVTFFEDEPVFPTIYADARFSFTGRKVSPFIGLDLGGALDGGKPAPYGNFQAGARIRTGGRNAWWISSFSEYVPQVLLTYGLKAGYSF